MAKALPPLTWFRAFEAAGRSLSFTAAAAEIGMTQSAVSQHVKSLETNLGVALFVRRARGLALTDDGRRLMPQVSAALETLTAAARTFDAGPTRNLLTVATSVSVAQWLIAPRLSDFTDRHPHLRLRFLSAIWPDDFQSLRADVEVPFGSHKQFGREATLLEPNDLVAVKSPALDGALHSLPLIEAVGTSAGWAGWPKRGQAPLKAQIFVDSFGAALNLALHGNGVALVSESLVRSAIATGQLVLADPGKMPGQEGYFVRADATNPSAMAFRDWLLEQNAAPA